MKLCVFGAGAIGGHLAGRLAQAGAAVALVARGAQLAAIRRDGLRVEAADATLVSRPRATDQPAELGVQDAVLVTTKAPALGSVAAALAPLLGPDTVVAFVTNGIPWWYFIAHPGGRRTGLPRLDPGGAVAAAVAPARILGGVVYSACEVTAPGVITVSGRGGRLILGAPDGAVSPAAAAIAALLEAGGMAAPVTSRIREAVWDKLLWNMAYAPLCVLAAGPPALVFADPANQDTLRRIVAEAAAIAGAMGCAVRPDPDAMLANGLKSSHRPSMLQDLELGRTMEIDAILDAPLCLARLGGVATPVLDVLVPLVKARARAAGL